MFELQEWEDVRLMYNTSEDAKCVNGAGAGYTTWISLPEEFYEGETRAIWTPDTYITNELHGQVEDSVIYVYMDGTVERV